MVAMGIKWQLGIAFFVPLVLIFISPAGDRDCLTAVSTLWGFTVGLVLERRWIRFCAAGVWWKRTLRFLLGLVLLFGLWMGLRVVFQGLEPGSMFRVFRYALVGLWCSAGAPWMFIRLKLADTK